MRAPAALLAIALIAAAPSAPTTQSVIAGIAAARKGLTSYIVPVSMRGSVHVKIVSVPFGIHGTEYFQAPDKQALHMVDVPHMAQDFSNITSSIGTPASWVRTYAISLQGTEAYQGRQDDVLVGVPRNGGNVKNVTVLVNPTTYAIDSAAFAYNNGSSLSLTLAYGANQYDLPVSANVTASFPGYKGGAAITYGAYQINVPVPASAFQQ